jgi:hypothetical protein
MARLLPILVFLGIAVILAIASWRRVGEARDGRAWRPRARYRGPGGRAAEAADADAFTVQARDIAGIRDAYSGETLDPSRPLARCAACRAFYHADSAAVLARENSGRCSSCGGADLRAVTLARD